MSHFTYSWYFFRSKRNSWRTNNVETNVCAQFMCPFMFKKKKKKVFVCAGSNIKYDSFLDNTDWCIKSIWWQLLWIIFLTLIWLHHIYYFLLSHVTAPAVSRPQCRVLGFHTPIILCSFVSRCNYAILDLVTPTLPWPPPELTRSFSILFF